MPDFASDTTNVGPYTYEIYKKDSNYFALNITTGVITSNTNARTLFQSVLDELSVGAGTVGGSVWVRKGVYDFDDVVNVSNATYETNRVRIKGEGIDSTIIRRITSAGHVFDPYCEFEVEDLTIDGNALATQLVTCGQPVSIRLIGCKFTKHTDIGVWFGGSLKGFIVDRCIFEDPRGQQDQMAYTCSDYGFVSNCYFNRTAASASKNGSCLTSGGGKNISITGNAFVRAPTDESLGFGVSFEFWGNTYFNCNVSNNNFTKSTVRLGGGGTGGVDSMRNISVFGNVANQCEIGIIGTDSDYGEAVRNVVIASNIITSSWGPALRVLRVAGQVNLSNNVIVDSNRGLNSNTFGDQGLVQINRTNHANVKNNTLYMSDTTSGASPYGIIADTTDRVVIEDNHIYNTTANPSITTSGTNTNLRIGVNPGYNSDINNLTETLSNKTISSLRTGYLSVTTTPVTLSASTDSLVKVDASGGARTVNLPAASGNSGLFYTIIKSDSSANTVTIDADTTETINGALTFVLTTQYQSVVLRCDGANWFTQPNSSERTGKAVASGNGSTTLFNIAHGLGSTPSNAMISVAKPGILTTYTVDGTNIAVTFASAPASASNNIEIHWRVVT